MLKALVPYAKSGARLCDVTAHANLPRPTVHRILQALVAEDLVEQQHTTRRYRIGPQCSGLAYAAANPFPHVASVSRRGADLARRTRTTFYALMRSGDDIVCIDKSESNARRSTNIIEPGIRRPLASSFAGIAFLAVLEPHEREEIIKRNLNIKDPSVEVAAADLRRFLGIAARAGIIHGECRSRAGVTVIATVSPNDFGAPFIAIALSVVSRSLTETRLRSLSRELSDYARELNRILSDSIAGVRRTLARYGHDADASNLSGRRMPPT